MPQFSRNWVEAYKFIHPMFHEHMVVVGFVKAVNRGSTKIKMRWLVLLKHFDQYFTGVQNSLQVINCLIRIDVQPTRINSAIAIKSKLDVETELIKLSFTYVTENIKDLNDKIRSE